MRCDTKDTPYSAALRIITDLYGEAVSVYVHKVARSESHSTNLDPEEVVSIAYVVLERAKRLYDPTIGEFTNYAIRALKHEFIRTKQRGYDLYSERDGSDTLQTTISTQDSLYAEITSEDSSIDTTLELQHREQMYLVMSAVLLAALTPFEKSVIYLSFFAALTSKTISFKHISEKAGVSREVFLHTYQSATKKLQTHLRDNITLSFDCPVNI